MARWLHRLVLYLLLLAAAVPPPAHPPRRAGGRGGQASEATADTRGDSQGRVVRDLQAGRPEARPIQPSRAISRAAPRPRNPGDADLQPFGVPADACPEGAERRDDRGAREIRAGGTAARLNLRI